MFRVNLTAPNRIDVEFSGKLDSSQMRQAIDELMSKVEGIENGRMLVRVGDYRLPTLGAIAVELSRSFELLRLMRRFDRAAVIADLGWIRVISEAEGAVIPGLRIRAFNSGEEAAAEAWLRG